MKYKITSGKHLPDLYKDAEDKVCHTSDVDAVDSCFKQIIQKMKREFYCIPYFAHIVKINPKCLYDMLYELYRVGATEAECIVVRAFFGKMAFGFNNDNRSLYYYRCMSSAMGCGPGQRYDFKQYVDKYRFQKEARHYREPIR